MTGGANPYRITGPAVISFSGGRSSGYMLRQILLAHDGVLPADVHVGFCNTGLEDPRTLDFVQECGSRWNVPIAWLEFDPTAEHQTAIVSHNSAARNGEPLAAAIATRPTPHLFNPVSRYCTGRTKIDRLRDYAKFWLGWSAWYSVIGLRADEPKRVASKRRRPTVDRQTFVLPMADAGVTKEDVARFWQDQPFDLRLPNDDGVTLRGNCVGCLFKKTRTLLRIFRADPSAADWWIEQEDEMERRVMSLPISRDPATGALRGPKLSRARFRDDRPSYRQLRDMALAESAQLALDVFDGEEDSVDCHCTA